MPGLRKIPVWVILASYLFANTIASSWHDHRDCSGHSEGAQPHIADCAVPDDHRGGKGHCCHHVHRHATAVHDKGPHACKDYDPCRISAGHENNGDDQHDSQRCVVCDFLALAPLAAPQAALELAGEVLPEFMVLDVLSISGTTVETHLARGPPAA